MDEWINRMQDVFYFHAHMHTHTGILLSHEKEGLPVLTPWMDLEGVMQSETSQTERQVLHDLTYMWNRKKPNSWKQRSLVVTRRVGELGYKLTASRYK